MYFLTVMRCWLVKKTFREVVLMVGEALWCTNGMATLKLTEIYKIQRFALRGHLALFWQKFHLEEGALYL